MVDCRNASFDADKVNGFNKAARRELKGFISPFSAANKASSTKWL